MFTVAIIGAGPAGATLARLLLTSSISSDVQVTVFEKDANRNSRFFLGGTLDLHPRTGLEAIKRANLWPEFRKHARYEGEEMRICDKNGTTYIHQEEAPQIEGWDSRPEIDREDLKELLVESIPQEWIQWGKHLKSVNAEKKTLTFADGSTAGPFDLIVGANGAWSKVRNILTDVKPTYSGICSMRARITPNTCPDPETWQRISAMTGKGNNFTFSNRRSFMAQRLGNGDISVGMNFATTDLEWSHRLLAETKDEVVICQRVLTTWYSDWDESFKIWFPCMTKFQPWTLYELPIGHRWNHVPGFTVIGDAAHLITPFAGEGANAAMKDAVELTEALETAIANKQDVDAAVASFEQAMFVRAVPFMEKTTRNKEAMFTEDAPLTFLSHMAGVLAKESGYDLNKGALSWIPIYQLVYLMWWIVGITGASRRGIRQGFKGQS